MISCLFTFICIISSSQYLSAVCLHFCLLLSSEIIDNYVDGVNITYGGGNRNVSWSTISNNVGYGFALWLNETTINYPIHQETVVAYSNISLNYDIGVLVGNFCGPAVVNISGNHFVFGRYIGMSLIFRKILQNLSYFWNNNTFVFCIL